MFSVRTSGQRHRSPLRRSALRLTVVSIITALFASTLVAIAPAELGPFSTLQADPAAAQSGLCPPGSTFLTAFNWSSAPGGSDNPANADGATWPINTTNKTWTNVGGSGLDVNIAMTGTIIDGTNGGQAGPGVVGNIDGFPTSTNEGQNIGGDDGAYGSDYLTLAMYSESSDDLVTVDFNFSIPVFFANDFTVDDVDWLGHSFQNPIPAGGFQDEVNFIADDGTGNVPVTVTPLGTATNISGQSAKGDVYDPALNGNVTPNDLDGQVLVTTPKPFTTLSLEYSNGPDDQVAELADPNNPGTWDGVSNGHAVRLGGFSLCEPDPASISLEKTVYEGHDAGTQCTGSELITGLIPGEAVTYCFDVTNSGDTFLDTITIDDPDLGLASAGVPPLGYIGTPIFPMAPGDTITMYYEAGAPPADLVNTATAEGIPVYADGTVIPFQNPVTDVNTAEVQVASPAITLVKDVIVGHTGGAGCATAANTAAITPGIPVTYCFTVTNSGDTPLTSITLDDSTLGSPVINQTVGPLPNPLNPGDTVVFYYETTATTSLTNTASVTAVPANPDGSPVPGGLPVNDDDTAIVTEEAPGLQIEKTVSTNGSCPGSELVTQVAGDALSYCFEVINTGSTSLANVTIADADIPGFNPSNLIPVSGTLALIAPSSSAVVRYDTVATVDVLPNTASATGTPSDATGTSLGLGNVSDDDTASVDVVDPSVQIIKTVVPEGSACPGINASTLQVAAGSNVVYCFTVTNTGDTDLIDLALNDATLAAAGVDVSLLAVSDLAPTDSVTVASPATPAADLTNTAGVSGTPAAGGTAIPGLTPVTDSDDAIVDVVTPGIQLVKTVVGGGSTAACPGSPSLDAGTGVAITYCFEITNTGETHLDLAGMTFNDPTLGITAADLVPVGAITDPLPPAGTAMYAYTTTMGGTLTNTADVSADPVDASGDPVPGANPVDDSDTADVVLATPAVDISKTAYAGHDGGANCPGADLTTVNAGADVTYCFIVTNTSSDVSLANVVIDDPALSASYPGAITLLSGNPSLLGTGQSAVFFLDATAAGDLTNVADTTGDPADASGNPIAATPPTDDDPTTVDVVGAGIDIEKTVYLGHDGGTSCDGTELSTGISGTDVTYCFTVTNTGDTHLSGVTVSDPLLGITLIAPATLAPGASVTLFAETTITGDLLNTATATGTPSTAGGTPLPGIAAPSADDTAEVDEVTPAVTIDKSVYVGNNSGATCPTAGNSTLAVPGDAVTYCFEVTNTGDTHLDDLVVSDTTLGITIDATNEVALSGTLASLAPGASAVVYVEVTAGLTDVANIASVTGNPTTPTGDDIVGATDPTDTDDALLNIVTPSVSIAKTVSANGTCPGVESLGLVAGSAVSFCFEITNTGDTYLADLTIDDDIYGPLDATNTTAVSGTLSLVAPGATVVVRYDTTSPAADQINTATTSGTPTDNAGNPLGIANVDSDPDTAEITVVGPAVELVKTAVPAGTTCTGIDGTTLEVAAGSQVTYCFEVTNTGDTYLANITVDDPTLGVVGLAVADLPANGDSDIVSFGPVTATDAVNTAQTTASPADASGTPLPGVPDVNDTEVAEVDVLTPAIELQKTVRPGTSLNACPGSETVTAQNGVAVVYCFEVTNTGDAPLDNITITDPNLTFGASDPTLVSGVIPLAPGATATFAFASSIDGDLLNTATATGDPTDSAGNPLPGASSVDDTDTAEVIEADPAVNLVKTVYAGHDAGASCGGGNLVTGLNGDAVTYCFEVTNTSSSTTLSAATVNDPLVGPVTLIASGDTLLSPGETVVYYVESTINGDLINTATASGTPSDPSGNPLPSATPVESAPDTAEVDETAPAVDIEKTVYAGHDAGASCDGVELVSGLNGDAVTYCFTVTNTGTSHLTNVSVTDATLGLSLNVPGPLAPGASATVSHETTITGDLTNTASATGTPSNPSGAPIPGLPPVDSGPDTAEVDEVTPAVTIDKTVYVGSDAGASCATAANSALATPGDTTTYCFEVTNTGDTYLSNLVISDTTLGITIDSTNENAVSGSLANLAPGATAVVYIEVTAGVADVANIASVVGNPTDPLGGDLPGVPNPTDTDDALLNVVTPSVGIAKTVSANGTCPGVETVGTISGSAVSFCFEITNTGDTYLADLTIDDDIYGPLNAANTTAVTGTLSLVAPGATVVVRYDTTSPANDQVNTATTSGTPTDNSGNPLGISDIDSDPDTAEITIIGPAIELVKTAVPAGTACAGIDGTTLEVAAGSLVTYCFEVTNVGDTYLTDVTVDDPTLGVVGLAVADLPANGDSDIVSFGPVTATDAVNTAQASGTPADATGTPLPGVPDTTDTEVAEVDVLTPAIELQKTVRPGTNINACPGSETVTAQNGVDVVYCFEVTNTGDAPLDNITITDPDLTFGASDPTLVSGTVPLAPGASATYAFATTIDGDLLNTATAAGDPTDSAGNPLPGGSSVDDTDTAEVIEADAAISIIKTVYAGHDGGTSCGGSNLVSGLNGDAVTYCFEVTNTDPSTTLSGVSVSDPDVGPVTLIASGDTVLSPGETVVFYVDSTITGDLINTATASGTPSDPSGNPLPSATPVDSAPDTAEVNETAPAVDIEKTVYAGHNAGASCTGTELVSGLSGSAVTYCFEVTNTGDTYLTNVVVNDSTLGITLTVPGPIAPGASATVSHETTITGDLTNTASATGTPSNPSGAPIPGLPPVSSNPDDAEVDEINPAINIEKTVYAGQDGGASCTGAEQVSGLNGDAVTYCFSVTNTGDTPLAVLIEDAALGLGTSGAQPTALNPAGVSPLAPGATEIFFYESALTADLLNTADAVGTPTDPAGSPLPGVPPVSDTDTAAVDEVQPAITVEKTASTTGSCPGIEVASGLPGDTVTYCFEVTNTGDTALSGVTLDDSTLGITDADMVATSGTLALIPVGGTVTLEYATTIAGGLINNVTTEGTPSDPTGTSLGLPPVDDTDSAAVIEVGPAVTLAKTVSTDGTCPGTELAGVTVGATLTYCFEVTNTGDTHLNGITITDPLLGLTLSDPTLLAPTESVTLSAPATATIDLVNTASVEATPTDSAGNPHAGVDPVTDSDPAAVDILTPGIELSKTVSASGSCPGVGNLNGGEGIALTYCFEILNTGTTHLDLASMSFDDADLGITETDLTLESAASTPLAPGDSALYSYSGATLPAGGLLNTADVSAAPVDGSGDPIPGPGGPAAPVSDVDTAEVVEATAGISIVKTVYAGHDAGAGCPGLTTETVDAGTAVTYCFTVTNTSATSYLADVTIDDATIGATYPGGPSTTSIVLVSGNPSLLAPGASAEFYFEASAANDITNVASTTGEPADASGTPIPTSSNPTASDDASVDVVAPALTIDKTVYEGHNNGLLCGSADADDLAAGTAGQPVTYCFEVANTGDTYLNGVTVDDSVLGVSLTDPTLLAPGASVMLFTESTITADLVNTATATGDPSSPTGTPLPDVDPPTSGPDDAEVNLVAPAIQLEKTVYAGAHDGGARCDTAGVELASGAAGATVTWCFTVTNTGDTALDSIAIDDPTLGLTDSSTLIAVSGAAPLAPGDQMTLAYEGTLSGDQVNVATATGTPTNPDGSPLPDSVANPTDDDSATVDTIDPSIELVKTISVDGTCPGSPSVFGELGDAITYCFIATNDGDTELINVTVDDATLGLATADLTLVSGSLASLAVGDSVILSYESTVTGDLVNDASTSATPADGSGNPLPDVNSVADGSQALVTQAVTSIELTKTVSVDGTCPGFGMAEIAEDTPITWCLTATNTGQTFLSSLQLSDAQLGLTPLNQSTMAIPDPGTVTLAPAAPGATAGESATFAIAATATADLSNTATVTATPSDPDGNPLPGSAEDVADPDTAEIDVVTPGITLEKTVSADGTCPGVDSLAAGNSFTATYCFEVTNSGETLLGNIAIDDPQLGATTSDLTAVSILDDDDSLPLSPGGTMMFSFEAPIDGDLLNTATATGDPLTSNGDPLPGPGGQPLPAVTDTDTAAVLEADSAIAIVKTIYVDHDGGAGCPGTETATADSGDAITFCFNVVNTDPTNHLSNVTVDDATLGITTADLTVVAGDPSDLAPGESVTFSYETTATGNVVNTASTTGDPTDPSGTPLPGVEKPTDEDSATVTVAGADISIVKAAYLGHDGGARCPGVDPLLGTQGQEMTWCFYVTNTGDTALIDATVTDTDLGLTLTHTGILQPGTSVTLHHETVLDTEFTNTASATGTPSSPTGTPLPDVAPPTSTDTGVVDIVEPSMTVDKTVYNTHNAGADCLGEESIIADHGSQVTWCVEVTNTGDTALGDFEIIDAALDFTTADFSIVEGSTPLAPGESVWFFAESIVDDSLTNEIVVAAAPYGEIDGLPIPGVDPIQRIDTATLERTPFDLVIVKTLDATDGAKRTARWKLTVENNGPGVAAGPITVTDPLPAALSYISGGGNGFVCTGGQTVSCVLDQDLEVGERVELLIDTNISASASGVINNVATVTSPLGGISINGGPGETTLDNNNSAAPVSINGSGQIAFTGSSSGTMVRLALGLIAIGLLFIAVTVVVRRQDELDGTA